MRDCKAIIEFGTSKISCTIAERRQRMGLEVLGCSRIAYSGIRQSNWVDSDEVYYALEQVLESAERQAGFRIKSVEVGIPGSFIKIVSKTAQIPIKGRVTERDVEYLTAKAQNFKMAEDYSLVYEWPAWFFMEDGNVYLDPVGVQTKKMRGCISFTYANRFFLNDVIELFRHLGVKVENFVPEPLAEALYLVPQERRDSLAILVDVGYYTTNVSLIYGDAILYFRTIPMGGGSITSDIAYIMKLEDETAEQLKRRYSFGLEENNNISYMYAKDSEGKLKKFPYHLVKEIMDARVEHLVLYITKIFARTERGLDKRIDVFLTGGGIAYMRGSGSFYRAVSGRAPLSVKVNSVKLQEPGLHAAYAMMQFAYDGVFEIKPRGKRRASGKNRSNRF
jgi:cell division protein FtsA